MALLHVCAYRANCLNLVIPASDILINPHGRKRQSHPTTIHEPLEILGREDPRARPLRSGDIIAEVRLEPIAQKDERSVTVAHLKTLRVKTSLLEAFLGIMHGALCFNDGERLSICSVKDVIDVPNALGVGHSLDLDFRLHVALKIPARTLDVKVNIAPARLAFRNGIGIEVVFDDGLSLSCSKLRTQLLNLLLLAPNDVFLLGEKSLTLFDCLNIQR